MATLGRQARTAGPASWRSWLRGLRARPAPWLLVAPSLLLLLVMTVYPTLSTLYLSLHRWEATMIDRPFIGFDNYARLVSSDARFHNALVQTVIIVGVALLLQVLLGFALALLFDGEFWAKGLLTTLYLVPMMISPVVVGFTARMAFTNQYGFVAQIINTILPGDTKIQWLADPFWAKVVVIVADTWQWTPFVFLVLYSALLSLPQEPFEAAQVDGASYWQAFWHITLPQMRYALLVAVLIRGLDLLKLFDVVLLSTRAGPGTSTETVSIYIYHLAFRFWSLGYAAAASFLLLLVVIVITSLLIRTMGSTKHA
jgi:multiple sugar transport system permease protein